MQIVDANVILRYLLNDNESLASRAATVIESTDVFVPFEVIAEVVYVLLHVYNVPRRKVYATLRKLLDFRNIQTTDAVVLEQGLRFFASSRLDFVDCLLFAYNHVHGHQVHTFDKRLKKLLK
ncbi:type II toxin-antitoxin system VapC family toxin [Sphingobacteriales bacterium CHB3]|nr:type II toxin-antitoxin system VapC family toxin [Sphingobacteriales bacterium CHB3]